MSLTLVTGKIQDVYADEGLESSDARHISRLCADYTFSGDDVRAVSACKTLERLTHQNAQIVGSLMQAKANGKTLTYAEFGRVIFFVSANRLATNTIAEAYYRHGDLASGREYAIQAIGWSMYDAKNVHDLIVTLHLQAKGQDYLRQRKLLENDLTLDKKIAPNMERLYPGVIDQAISKLHMSRPTFVSLMQSL